MTSTPRLHSCELAVITASKPREPRAAKATRLRDDVNDSHDTDTEEGGDRKTKRPPKIPRRAVAEQQGNADGAASRQGGHGGGSGANRVDLGGQGITCREAQLPTTMYLTLEDASSLEAEENLLRLTGIELPHLARLHSQHA